MKICEISLKKVNDKILNDYLIFTKEALDQPIRDKLLLINLN